MAKKKIKTVQDIFFVFGKGILLTILLICGLIKLRYRGDGIAGSLRMSEM